jgi:hypothetical protein
MKGHSSSGKLNTTRPKTKRHIPNDLIFISTAVRTQNFAKSYEHTNSYEANSPIIFERNKTFPQENTTQLGLEAVRRANKDNFPAYL